MAFYLVGRCSRQLNRFWLVKQVYRWLCAGGGIVLGDRQVLRQLYGWLGRCRSGGSARLVRCCVVFLVVDMHVVLGGGYVFRWFCRCLEGV